MNDGQYWTKTVDLLLVLRGWSDRATTPHEVREYAWRDVIVLSEYPAQMMEDHTPAEAAKIIFKRACDS
jgi:hypothetical protein